MQLQVEPCVWYREEIALLFYVENYVKDKIDAVYTSMKTYLKFEDDEALEKYLGIDLDWRPDGSIHLHQPFLTQKTINMIPVLD